MNVEEAKQFKMVHGKYKDVSLSRIPSFYLKWLAKNWDNEGVRNAATLVINSRSLDVGAKGEYKASYQPKEKQTCQYKQNVEKQKVDFGHVAFGELKELIEESEPDLF